MDKHSPTGGPWVNRTSIPVGIRLYFSSNACPLAKPKPGLAYCGILRGKKQARYLNFKDMFIVHENT